MHILVTDVLACPRCGPGFGLILLAERVVERRVLEGELGCPNCRDRYPIRRGFADLRTAPERSAADRDEAAPDSGELVAGSGTVERATRLAALLGLSEPRRLVLLMGPLAREAAGIADLVQGVEVIAAGRALESWTEEDGVSRIAVGEALPFLDRSLGGVGLSGATDARRLESAARAVAPLGRLVLEESGSDAEARLDAEGLEVLAADGGTFVATRRTAL